MEVLHHSVLSSSTTSLRFQTEKHRLNVSTAPVAISATLNHRIRPLRGFFGGFNELASKVFTIASRGTRPHSVIVMRANAASGYASALAEVARSHNVLESINIDMQKLGKYLQDKQLFDFLTNPTISGNSKKSVLKSLAHNANFASYTANLLNLIIDKKRTLILKEIIKEFEEIYNEITATEVAIVTSAIKISTNQLAQIAMKVQSLSGAKNVRMKNVVDKSLVAGFAVRFGKDGSRFIDMSVKGQLAQIATRIDLGDQSSFASW